MRHYLVDEPAMLSFGSTLLESIRPGMLIFLRGNLGAGKTTLVRGVLRALGYQGAVKSPTFTLVEEYKFDETTFYHFDLYRLADPEELEWMGMSDYLRSDAVCFVEWPEKGEGFLPAPDLTIEIYPEKGGRGLLIENSKMEKNL